MSLQLDLTATPFSRAGSWMAISRLASHKAKPAGLYLRSVREVFEVGPLFRIELVRDGRSISFREKATAGQIVLKPRRGRGWAQIAFDGPSCVRLRCRGIGLRLAAGHGADNKRMIQQVTPAGENLWRALSSGPNRFFFIARLQGALDVKAPWDGKGSTKASLLCRGEGTRVGEIALVETQQEWEKPARWRPFDACVADAQREYASFLAGLPRCEARYRTARERAGYIKWSCWVDPAGHLRRRAMIVSKNWMSGMWAWDHCFNAIALSQGHPQMAWDQYMGVLEHANKQGAIPDLMTETLKVRIYEKPPVHGWTLMKMMERNPRFFTLARLREAYEALSLWTSYWVNHRDPYRTGLPVYYHGNDSGWDNSTCFLAGSPLITPDLAAYLVIQMEVLAGLARRLRRPREAARWQSQSRRLLARMMERLWRKDRFIALCPATKTEPPKGSDSLLPFMALVLGKRLPGAAVSALKEGLLRPGRFLTRWGLASESLSSPYYTSDGYWRGPIWAPSTMLLVDGLMDVGEKDLARFLARQYCDLCARHGFAENFDAQSGQGYRDLALTWTASVFLLLANLLMK